MKKITLSFIALLILSTFLINCGGGSGGSSSPGGEKPGVPEIVQVLPSHYIALTNSAILIRAKILNGNGGPVKNLPVTFTNISPIGTLMNSNDAPLGNQTVVKTDDSGMATIKVKSTTTGFVTVQAEVNKGVGIVRDRKTMYFSSSLSLSPFMYLDVDGDDDGIYDEGSDYILFENSTDNQVLIRATVFNRFGQRAFGSGVTFGADWPYKIGSSTTCSDGSSSCEVSFPNGNTATTDSSGEAFVLVRVDPVTIRNITTILNITASADNGAANMVTLQLLPVTISTVTVSATPPVVEPAGTSKITAAVTLNTGAPAFDGTVVSFTTICGTTNGSVTPFSQTTDGAAEATFTAPSTEDTCTITATSGGVSASTDILVTSALTVLPDKVSVNGAAPADIITFTIFGGISPYTVTSSDPAITISAITATATGGTFTATVPAGTAAGSVTLTVRDSAGTTATATITITSPALNVLPPTQTLTNPAAADTATYTISGGSAPYSAFSSHPLLVNVAVAGTTLTATVIAVPATDTTVTITVSDNTGNTKTATLVLDISALVINPSSVDLTDGPSTQTFLFQVSGGGPNYTITSSNPAIACNDNGNGICDGADTGTWTVTTNGGTFTVTVEPNAVIADTTVTLTVQDSIGTPIVNATLNITN